jgi:DNA-binding transcriptional LysR family regulator
VNSAEIETFLAICRHRSISRASEELFISQSTLSTRLKSLEEHLGCPLLLRGKGSREVTLTAWGQAFYDLALQYQDITRKMESLNTSILVDSLTVSTIYSVGAHLLLPVFERFLQEYPQVHLAVQDLRAEMAVSSIVLGNTDVAFTTSKIQTSQVIATPFLSDPMTVICSEAADYPETVSLDMLSVNDEAYVLWSAECEHWHHSVFDVNAVPPLHVELDEQIALFVSKYNKWACVPLSVAKDLVARNPIRQLKPDFPIPDRNVYILRNRDTAESDNIHRFLNTVRDVLAERGTVGLLL